MGLLIHDPKDDFIMLPGTILRPEGFPKLADLVGHSARMQDTGKAGMPEIFHTIC